MEINLLNQRIAQWEKMTRDDPDNAMGWFSLGSAYREAEREEEAARAFRKAIELDPNLSRAYQLLAQTLIAAGADGPALEVLEKGYPVAAERGDIMPMRAMESLFKKLGKPVPAVAGAAPPPELSGDSVLDRRTGQPGPRLPDSPMRGPIGRFIYDHYSAPTFREWVRHGTKVINELRLDFSRLDHQDIYEQHMMEWLGFTRQEVEEYDKTHPR
jgi:Fe-S cluster biosynthesis and repair protein YggX